MAVISIDDVPLYGQPGDGYRPPVDLQDHYRPLLALGGNLMAFVCPRCKAAFPPHLAQGPESFRAHLRPITAGKGCSFKPIESKESK